MILIASLFMVSEPLNDEQLILLMILIFTMII